MVRMRSPEYSATQRTQLLDIARASMTSGVETGAPLDVDLRSLPAVLTQNRASFVTLRRFGELRGCTGSLQASQPLAVDVAKTACQTALCDPRFNPLQTTEVDETHIEISVLSPLTPIEVDTEAQLLATLLPEVDGVVLEAGHRRATFLPKVWEQVPDAQSFLGELKHKAGLSQNYWSSDIKLYRYHTETFSEAQS